MSDYPGSGKYYTKKNKDMIIAKLKEKYAELEEQHATNLVERNSYLLETERLKDTIKELETELYFSNRNKRIGEVVDERTEVETQKKLL